MLLIGILFLNFANGISQQFEFRTSELPRYRNGKDAIMAADGSIVIVGGWLRNDSISGIYRSTDSIKTWNIIKDQLGPMFNSIIQLNANKFLAMGRSGRIATTDDLGLNWNLSQLNNLQSVEFTHAAFSTPQNGMLIGWDDQKQKTVIVKTANAAQNIEIVLDTNFGKPQSILNIDSLNYWVITLNGSILQTNNAGKNWTNLSYSTTSNCKFYSVSPISNQHFLLVGVEINGSDTNQTIWEFNIQSRALKKIYATKGYPFTQVKFLNGESYLLSQNGGFYYSNDTCKTIKSVNLPNQSTDNRTLNNIRMITPGTGIICGNQGRTLYFTNNDFKIPTAQIERIFVTKKLEVKIRSSIQPKGLKPNCYLIFENSNLKKDSIYLGKIDGFDKKEIISYLNLSEDVYTFKIVGYYQTNSFQSLGNKIDLRFNQYTNLDFEHWDSLQQQRIQSWGTVGTVLLDSNWQNVKLKSFTNEPGGVYLATVNQDSIRGGIPIESNFDTLYLKCKYQIASKDSAYLSLRFKNSTLNQFYRLDYRWSGNSLNDTILKLATKIPAISFDSLILIVLTTDYFNNRIDTNSTVWLDSIWTNNSKNPFPNSGFTNWRTEKMYSLINWGTMNNREALEMNIQPSSGYSQSSRSLMFSLNQDINQGRLYYKTSSQDTNKSFPPKMKIQSNHKSIHGYYKFLPKDEQDTLFFEAYVYKDSQIIGHSINSITQESTEWGNFTFPVNYYSNDSATDISISFGLSSKTNSTLTDKAIAFLDDISFDFALDSNFTASTVALKFQKQHFWVYPNPTEKILHLQFSEAVDLYGLKIFNLSGNLVYSNLHNSITDWNANQKNEHLQIDCSNLSSGLYIGEITHNLGKNQFKFQLIK